MAWSDSTKIDMNACNALNGISYADTCISATGDYVWTDGTACSTKVKSNYNDYNITVDNAYTSLEDWVKECVKTEIDNNKNTKKENDNMKGFNFDFGPCGNTVRLSMYGMAVQNTAGEWVSYNSEAGEIINVDVFNMADGGKYMYKIPVAISEVNIGDIVVHNRVPMFVTAIDEDCGSFTVVDVRAGEYKNIIPTKNMFGFNFMTKVVSLFDAFSNAPTADHPFGNMLPFLMSDGEVDPMMMFFMMNQSGEKNTMFSNPMMMYFMMKDNKNVDPMMLMFMMNQNK